jgi:alpha-galactosidase
LDLDGRRFVPWLLAFAVPAGVSGAPVATCSRGGVVLDNGAVRLEVTTAGASGRLSLATASLAPAGGASVARGPSPSFRLLADGVPVGGQGPWASARCEAARDARQGEGASILLAPSPGTPKPVEVRVTWLVYPGLPVVRKRLVVRNAGTADLRLEGVDVERLSTTLDVTHTWTMASYGRQKRTGPYSGDWDDALVTLHEASKGRGLALGNEAPGVLKRTTAFLDGSTATVGLTGPGDPFPFRKWLRPGETWESPWVFLAPYEGTDDPYAALNGPVNAFVRRHLGVRLADAKRKPVLVYNTWMHWSSAQEQVAAAPLRDLAVAAAEAGAEEFVIDAGWYALDTSSPPGGANADDWMVRVGDYRPDPRRFPEGLGPVFDHVRSLGMRPGLWISLGTANHRSKVFREHPEWFVRDEAGRPVNLHEEPGGERATELATACLATGWAGYIQEKILDLVERHGLAYAKLDLSVVTSAYRYLPATSGCSAKEHPGHRDREESLGAIYDAAFSVFDRLHERAPDLFLDCTFETMGKLQLVDYAMLRHAEGNWLSNFDEPAPLGPLRVRQMAWWRAPAITASALVIGNQRLDDPRWELALQSVAGSFPIMLGDVRKVPPATRARMKTWTRWLRAVQDRHDFLTFREDLPGFGEPAEGSWDGFARLNRDSGSGGIVGVFRQGAAEAERLVTIRGLDPAAEYVVRRGPDGGEVARLDGRALAETGFRVRLSERYDGTLLEVARPPAR